MEDITPTPAPVHSALFCKACSAKAEADDTFCTNCGYPLHGTEEEQRYFISVRDAKIIDLSEAQKQIRRSSVALYIIGGLTAVAGLGFWCNKKPLTAIISGASLYALMFILNAVLNPLTILSGIIFKIIIIGLFIRGIKSAIEAEKLKKELNAE